MKCGICGTEFRALRDDHYIVRDLTKTGLAAVVAANDEPGLYDAFDCPVCGCQVVAQPRKRKFLPCENCDQCCNDDETDDNESDTGDNENGAEDNVRQEGEDE